ncbi:MAG: hypothetical protein Q8K97_09410 [Pseudohongiella sp.]|nr:hypothetical protein [Pseudohongiella sp.]
MEILICIPEQEIGRVAVLSAPNVKVVVTTCRGQVAQRAYGLKLALYPYVLQMDDDITLKSDTLLSLCQALELIGPRTAISPSYRHCRTWASMAVYKKGVKGFLQNCVATVICGAHWGIGRMGTVAPCGTAYGIDPELCNDHDSVAVEWLPGGCVLCFKQDLVTENYFPFPGKAYCEDVIHSVLWRRNGVSLFVLPKIDCYIDDVIAIDDSRAIKADYRARKYLVALNGGSQWRCFLYNTLYAVKMQIGKLRQKT